MISRRRSGAAARSPDILVAIVLPVLVFAGAGSCGGARLDTRDAGQPLTGEEVMVTPVFEPSRPIADCTATLGSASGPVALAATISCARKGAVTAVGAGVAGAGYVLVSGYDATGGFSRVLSISATGAIVADEGPASSGNVVGLIVQPGGAADLVGIASNVLGLDLFRPADGGWMREPVLPVPPGMPVLNQNIVLRGLARAADGAVYLNVYHVVSSGFYPKLLARAPSGQWTRFDLSIQAGSSTSALAVRPAGEPLLVYLAHSTPDMTAVLDAVSTGAIPTFPPLDLTSAPQNFATMMSAAADSAGVTVGLQTRGDGLVLYRPAGASPRTVKLAGTAAPARVGCPELPTTSTMALAPRPCSETGVGGAGPHALVLGADGAPWVAYLVVHLDRDLSQSCVADGAGGFNCGSEITTDRSTLEVVLERVAADGSHAVKWRAPAGVLDVGYVFMDRREARLHLAFSPVAGLGSPPSVQYAVVDTTRM